MNRRFPDIVWYKVHLLVNLIIILFVPAIIRIDTRTGISDMTYYLSPLISIIQMTNDIPFQDYVIERNIVYSLLIHLPLLVLLLSTYQYYRIIQKEAETRHFIVYMVHIFIFGALQFIFYAGIRYYNPNTKSVSLVPYNLILLAGFNVVMILVIKTLNIEYFGLARMEPPMLCVVCLQSMSDHELDCNITCPLCDRIVLSNEDWTICQAEPSCKRVFHTSHYKNSIKIHNTCPQCGLEITNFVEPELIRDLVNSHNPEDLEEIFREKNLEYKYDFVKHIVHVQEALN